MKLYDFEVLCGDEVMVAVRSVPLDSPRAAWPKIIKLARSAPLPGCRIKVKEMGETIILTGASAALRLSRAPRASSGSSHVSRSNTGTDPLGVIRL